MFAFTFRFPAGRYHATPWGRNVNEADVAWPPEPWRILRALVACYWRKGDRKRWGEDDLAQLVDALAEELPVFCLPKGAVHAHTRHYMPLGDAQPSSGMVRTTLVFDAFVHLPQESQLIAVWQDLALDGHLVELADDLAAGMGYLGRAESWVECRVVTECVGKPNCGPAELGFEGDSLRVLVPRSRSAYEAERKRLIAAEAERIQEASKKRLTERALQTKVGKSFRAKGGVDTLPPRLLDAISVETGDLQHCKWNRPPAAYEAIYRRSPESLPGVVPRRAQKSGRSSMSTEPTIARYLLAGRPRPRIEDAVKIGEVMRLAAMSKFGWDVDDETGKKHRLVPWQISGRVDGGRPVSDPRHPHAFWLPEDADGDGWIDHVTVFVAGGMDATIQSRLDRVTRIWLSQDGGRGRKGRTRPSSEPRVNEWRLALEGFGRGKDFEGASPLLGVSRFWRSITPFLAPGHLKKGGRPAEAMRLMRRRGMEVEGVKIKEIGEVSSGGTPRRALNFHRFRSTGRERQLDSAGALLEIEFPEDFRGPLALGYGCHFGLGMFGAPTE